jgi:hypothetical protein
VLAGIEAAGLELAEGHAAGAAAGAEDHRLDGDEVEELRLAGCGREDTDADESAGAAKASGRGQAEEDAVFTAPDEGIAGGMGLDPLGGGVCILRRRGRGTLGGCRCNRCAGMRVI